MTAKKFQPNPLNLFNLRRVEHCPPHFYAVEFDSQVAEKKLSDWIWENLSGRFFLGDVFITTESKREIRKRAGFEIHGEATYFALQINEINKF